MLLTVAPGVVIRGKSRCVACGDTLARNHRVVPVWIVAGIARGQLVLQGRTDAQAPQNEYFHTKCCDPKHQDVATIVPVLRPTLSDANMTHIEPRGDDSHCIECKKLFVRGDRIVLSYIVQGVEKDPETGAIAAKVLGDYEPKHADCADTKLEFGKSVLVVP